jgi:flagellar biosynthesis protein FlhA
MNKRKLFAVFFIFAALVTVILVNIGCTLYSICDMIMGKIDNNDIWLIISYSIISILNIFVFGKGAIRTTEVAARFSLDSLPIKRMTIDSDLKNKTIDFDEANNKKIELSKETDFWGQIHSIARIVGKLNMIIIVLQFTVVLILEICYRIIRIRIEINHINNILENNIIAEFMIFMIFTAVGYLVAKHIKNNDI